MIKKHFIKPLHIICDRLKDTQFHWVVTGNLGMALQGMDIEVHDIDIQTNQFGVYEIEGMFSEYVIQPVRYLVSERMRSHLGNLEINGVEIDIIGDVQKLLDDRVWEDPIKVDGYKHWVDFDNLRVPVLSLDYEYEAYLKMGRIEKAKKIKSWLETKHV